MSQDRLQILKMLEAGQVSTEEALKLLEAVEEAHSGDEMAVETTHQTSAVDIPSPGSWWLYIALGGAVVMAIGAPLLAFGLMGKAALFWAIFCGWIPFLIGLAILTLGVWSRNARWFHLRIRSTRAGGSNFTLSLPLPLTLTAWILRLVRPYVAELRETAVDEAILAMRDGLSASNGQPIYIDVNDGKDGEQVMIYFG